MPNTFEKKFVNYCNEQELEVNTNQVDVIQKLEKYAFIYMEM
jgi:cell division protein ZapE